MKIVNYLCIWTCFFLIGCSSIEKSKVNSFITKRPYYPSNCDVEEKNEITKKCKLEINNSSNNFKY